MCVCVSKMELVRPHKINYLFIILELHEIRGRGPDFIFYFSVIAEVAKHLYYCKPQYRAAADRSRSGLSLARSD